VGDKEDTVPLRWDLHIHSKYSGDSDSSVEEIVRKLKEKGCDGFALTDHCSIAGWKEAQKYARKYGLKFVKGQEVHAIEGHIVALGISREIPMDLPASEAVRLIHKQNGVAIAAHPFDVLRGGVGNAVRKVEFDGIETLNGRCIKGNGKTRKVCEGLDLAPIGSSDAHSVGEIGNVWTESGSEDIVEDIKNKKTKAMGKVNVPALVRKTLERKFFSRL
jgi:predicted metal-dependent phosphoesterase TrpH